MPPTPPPILDYANAGQTDGLNADPAARWHAMLRWRDLTFACLVATPVAFSLDRTFGLLAFAALVVATTLTLISMTRTAAHEISPAYAVRHLILALLLLPIFFLGPLLVPKLVQADARRLRLSEEDDNPPS